MSEPHRNTLKRFRIETEQQQLEMELTAGRECKKRKLHAANVLSGRLSSESLMQRLTALKTFEFPQHPSSSELGALQSPSSSSSSYYSASSSDSADLVETSRASRAVFAFSLPFQSSRRLVDIINFQLEMNGLGKKVIEKLAFLKPGYEVILKSKRAAHFVLEHGLSILGEVFPCIVKHEKDIVIKVLDVPCNVDNCCIVEGFRRIGCQMSSDILEEDGESEIKLMVIRLPPNKVGVHSPVGFPTISGSTIIGLRVSYKKAPQNLA